MTDKESLSSSLLSCALSTSYRIIPASEASDGTGVVVSTFHALLITGCDTFGCTICLFVAEILTSEGDANC